MRHRGMVGLVLACGTLAACSGGGSSLGAGGGGGVNPPPTAAPTQGPSTQQIISLALPSTSIGQVVDPTFGLAADTRRARIRKFSRSCRALK